MPFLKPEVLAYIISTCLEPIRQQLKQNHLKIRDLCEQVNTRWVDADEMYRYDADLTTFVNVNTPEALRAAELSLHRPGIDP